MPEMYMLDADILDVPVSVEGDTNTEPIFQHSAGDRNVGKSFGLVKTCGIALVP